MISSAQFGGGTSEGTFERVNGMNANVFMPDQAMPASTFLLQTN
jgi:hypothetical protein